MSLSGTQAAMGMLRRAARRLVGERLLTWPCPPIEVIYRKSLDGNGAYCAGPFVQFIRGHCNRRPLRFQSAFEWCSGPGFIGFSLLAAEICDRICLADINPAAIDCVRRTVARNHLDRGVSYYVSDNFARIPPREQFDLIVGNPPSYCRLNPAHPFYDRYKGDLRVNDPGWRIRRDFYQNVKRYMRPGAWLFLAEVAVNDAEFRTAGFAEPYDIRPRPPLMDFQEMVAAAGLTFVGVEPLLMFPGGFPVEILIAINGERA